MAELPDLTVYARILSRRFVGKTLKKLDVKVAKKLNVTVDELQDAIVGKKLTDVSRYGKTLHFHFSGDTVLQIHLMLRGELALLSKENPDPKYGILGFTFTGGEGFAVTDLLRQATPTLHPESANAPDALEIKLAELGAVLSKSKKMVKEVLMDQKKMRGIGNSYADEILWHARISPFSIANAIPEKAVKKLLSSMGTVLNKAIEEIAEENGDELHGELRDVMKVHGAKIEKSPGGAVIKSEKIGGRTSYYTDEQELYN
ncbi:formamidopyrimidine-DNA glycosylase [Pedobacter westerhofensis]|uniref:Formamidopyrimidine-DNA glycosylase n=1 Tax=Pedobacter westerhofensis TaxID=425512 RepID=A0A521BEA3_9SPHI|nr:DNA-formamidopyrimidine glycosylase family protein [Pedobacter westerhofensis]SMO45301.1 formamidopyrimidine-DNA glycosylase [Pedobacter westerhofensis]